MLRKLFLSLLIIISVCYFVSMVSCHKSEQKHEYNDDTEQPPTDEHKTDTDKQPAKPDSSKTLKYTYQWSDSDNIPPVAIVIDDFGQIGGKLLDGFAELDDNVTFAILPDLPNTQKTAKLANVYGHEVIIHIPMQALDKKQNPGKTYIKVGQDKSEIKAIVNRFMEQIPQAIGANNHMGSGVTSDYASIHAVLETLNQKGLFFLDSKTTPQSKAVNAASDIKIDYAARDIFLDVPDVSNATLNSKLKELQKFKGRKEPVIIISHCHNQAKLEAMQSFISQLKGMNVKLIPISDAVKKFNLPA